MGRKCCVPNCYTGYATCKDKASMFRVPDDDFFLSKWQEAVAREDRPITPKDYVCVKHFKPEDIVRRRFVRDAVEEYKVPKLKPDAVPSVFPEMPEFILKMVKKRRKMPDPKEENTNKPQENEIIKSNVVTNINTEVSCDLNSGGFVKVKEEVKDDMSYQNLIAPDCLDVQIDIKNEVEDIEEACDDLQLKERMFKCEECSYETKYLGNLKTHKTKHLTGEDAFRFRCEHCPKFKTKWALTYKNHLRITHGIGKQLLYECSLCPFKTKIQCSYKRHLARHEDDSSIKYNCHFCVFKTNHRKLFISHVSKHNEAETAMVVFSTSDEKEGGKFENNIDIDQKKGKIICRMNLNKFVGKKLSCTECFFKTNYKNRLVTHMKSAHSTGDNNSKLTDKFSCDQCSYSSSELTALESHKYLEHNKANGQFYKVKPTKSKGNPNVNIGKYKCTKCKYRTNFRGWLVKHLSRHGINHNDAIAAKSRPIYKCPQCTFETRSKNNLQQHSICHLDIISFKCDECPYETVLKQNYFTHMLTHRNISVEFGGDINSIELNCALPEDNYTKHSENVERNYLNMNYDMCNSKIPEIAEVNIKIEPEV